MRLNNLKRLFELASFALFTLFFTTLVSAAPTPYVYLENGNITCKDISDWNDVPQLAHVFSGWELKINDPSSATYPFQSGGGVEVTGGMEPSTNLFMNVALGSGGTVMTSWSMSWTSPIFLNRFVSAVIVKGGNGGANIYPYNPLDNGDVGPFTVPTGQQISHISFCFEETTVVSAADATVSGRVTDRYGRGISGALLSIANLSTGATRSVVTNSFGHYSFKGLPVGDFYTLNIRHARYTFREPSRTFQLDDNLTGTDFSSLR